MPDVPPVPDMVDQPGVPDYDNAPMCHSEFTWDPVREYCYYKPDA